MPSWLRSFGAWWRLAEAVAGRTSSATAATEIRSRRSARGSAFMRAMSSARGRSRSAGSRGSTDCGLRWRAVKLRRLLPEPADLTPFEAVRGMRLADLAPPERPYLVLNMVSTLDGRITIDGRSGPIGDEADRELFHCLRTQADAVMVGAGTIRTERYGRIAKRPERREQRVAEGLDPDPLAVIVSARLRVPVDLPLLQDPDSTVAILTASEKELPEATPARVEYLRGPAGVELELRPLL